LDIFFLYDPSDMMSSRSSNLLKSTRSRFWTMGLRLKGITQHADLSNSVTSATLGRVSQEEPRRYRTTQAPRSGQSPKSPWPATRNSKPTGRRRCHPTQPELPISTVHVALRNGCLCLDNHGFPHNVRVGKAVFSQEEGEASIT